MTKTTTKPDATHTKSGIPLPDLLSLEETSRILGCSMKTVRRMIAAKTLPVVEFGRLKRVHPADLERLIAAHRSL